MNDGSGKTKEQLLAECMEEYARAKKARGLPRGDWGFVYRRWLDDIFTWRTDEKLPLRDDYGNVLKRWGPPLAWWDFITKGGRDGGMAADLDFYLERNGLHLVIEFKWAGGERRKPEGSDKLSLGQWRSLATLAKSGLFVVYVVEYTEPGGNDAPPTISRIRRLTDDVAPARRWKAAAFADVLLLVHQWWSRAGEVSFVRRQRAAATFMQFLQLQLNISAFEEHDEAEAISLRRAQHEAMRLAARLIRDSKIEMTWAAFEAAYRQKLEERLIGAAGERSTD